ncbi:BRCT domain-containing protein [Panaeolus papilionaceus]|nr:BRCT domain-containing protein [Panaeolus papilionaceus]
MERYFSTAPKPDRSTKVKGKDAQPSTTPCAFSSVTDALLGQLSHPLNPITRSDISERTDLVYNCATGHQIWERRKTEATTVIDREKQLSAQRPAPKAVPGFRMALSGAKIYVNGYIEGSTDTELKRAALSAGGQIVNSPTQCTHIITSRCLSGSKVHRFLAHKQRKKPYIVKPEWVFDSVAQAKRRPERPYTVLMGHSTAKFQENMSALQEVKMTSPF